MRYRIYLTGGDRAHWALDTELRLAGEALSSFADLAESPACADFCHTVDVNQTVDAIQSGATAAHVPVVGAINNHPTRLTELPGFVETALRSLVLVPQSQTAARDMDRLGLPYPDRATLAADFASYRPIAPDDPALTAFRRKTGLPADTYIIGLLQRDSDGGDLGRPKIQKGADNFVALMMRLREEVGEGRFHVLLGGPRRHWIRRRLEEESIPYTFVGRDLPGDDYPGNILDAGEMCMLYNLLDLYVIPTRWEGAPRQLFDVICCRKKLVSTPVGVVPEVLSPECIFRDIDEGASLIARDMGDDHLSRHIETHWQAVRERHTVAETGRAWRKIYDAVAAARYPEGLSGPRRFRNRITHGSLRARTLISAAHRGLRRLAGPARASGPIGFGVAGGEGGGTSPFMDALTRVLRGAGHRLSPAAGGDVDFVLAYGAAGGPGDTPRPGILIHLLDEAFTRRYAAADREEKEVFLHLQDRAAATLLASDNCMADMARAGTGLRNPLVLRLPPDPAVFFPGESKAETTRRILVVTDRVTGENISSVSALRLLQAPEARRIRALCAAPGDDPGIPVSSGREAGERAELMRSSDVAVFLPAVTDTFSLLECLACGLPILLHGELDHLGNAMGMAGLRFNDETGLRRALQSIRDHRRAFRAAIRLPYADEALDCLERLFRKLRNG